MSSAPRPFPLAVTPLTRAAFAPFGEILQADDTVRHFPINGGTTERFHDLARLDAGILGRVIVSIFRGHPRALPLTLSMLERHPLASQAFMPLGREPYLVVVAPPDEIPKAEQIRCFLAHPGQGVNYAAGVWHHPLLALNAPSDFLVLDRDGPGHNCDEFVLTPPVLISSADLSCVSQA